MSLSKRISLTFMLLAIFAAWLHQCFLIEMTQIHWDEFYFLSRVHAHQDGRWSHTIQSFYVHFFAWLTWAGPNEVDQAIYGRYFSSIVLTSTMAGCLYLICKRITGSAAAALAATFLALAHPFAAFQAFRFRADPMLCTGFLLAATILIYQRNQRPYRLAAATVLGIMGTISIKSILFTPSLALILLTPHSKESFKERLIALFEFAFTAMLVSLTLLGIHHLTLAEEGLQNSQTLVRRSGKTMFRAFFPRESVFRGTFRHDYWFWVPLFMGMLATLMGIVIEKSTRKKSALLAFAMCLPLLFPLFYRNAFSYFYICIIPPAAIGVGWMLGGFQRLLRHLQPKRLQSTEWLIALALIPFGLLAAQQGRRDYQDTISHQREFLDMVKKVFPKPSPYLDRCSMVSSHQKVGPFLTSWRLHDLRKGSKPTLRDYVKAEQPLYMVSNLSGLKLNGKRRKTKKTSLFLTKPDFEFLKQNYIKHVGNLWVAGKKINATNAESTFHIFIAGTYDVEADSPILIDKQKASRGSSIELTAGEHTIVTTVETFLPVVLRLGPNLPKPQLSNPKKKLFMTRTHPVR